MCAELSPADAVDRRRERADADRERNPPAVGVYADETLAPGGDADHEEHERVQEEACSRDGYQADADDREPHVPHVDTVAAIYDPFVTPEYARRLALSLPDAVKAGRPLGS